MKYLSYDCEVFPNFFMVDFYNPDDNVHTSFVFHETVSENEFRERYNNLKKFIEDIPIDTILISFNGISFDQAVIKAFLEKEINGAYEKSRELVGKKHYVTIKCLFKNNIEIDLYKLLPQTVGSLKKIEARLCLPIVEYKGFNENLPVSKIDEVVSYCQNDTYATWLVFSNEQVQQLVKARLWLKKESSYRNLIDDITTPDVVLTTKIIGSYIAGEYFYKTLRNSLSPVLVFTGGSKLKNITLDCFKKTEFQNVYKTIESWKFTFKDVNGKFESVNPFSLEIPFLDGVLKFGEGGLHYHCKSQYISGKILNIDVSSQYPSIIVNNSITPKYNNPEYENKFISIYRNLVKERLEAKASGDKVKANALKIPLNTISGCFKSSSSCFTNPSGHVEIVLNAQLYILKLIEDLMPFGKIVHVNTDGIVLLVNNENGINETITAWENKFNLKLERTEFSSFLAIDTNNYAFIDAKGNVVKGVGLTNRTIDVFGGGTEPMAIGIAVREYFVHSKPVAETIKNLIKDGDILPFIFIRSVKTPEKYKGVYRYILSKKGVEPMVSTLTSHGYKILIYNEDLVGHCDDVDEDAYIAIAEEKLFEILKNQTVDDYKKLYDYGFSIIPLKPCDKLPKIKWTKYQKERPSEEQITRWFGVKDKPNVGIVCGKVSGITVLDIDNKEKGKKILEKISPNTPVVETANGYHIYFRFNNENSQVFVQGLELKSDGCYVVAPPSIHKTGWKYRWLREFNQNNLEYFSQDMILESEVTNKKLYLAKPEDISMGNRNNTFTSMVGKWLSEGLEETEIKSRLIDINRMIDNPLPNRELNTIVNSVIKTDIKNNSEFVDIWGLYKNKFLQGYKYLPFTREWYKKEGINWIPVSNFLHTCFFEDFKKFIRQEFLKNPKNVSLRKVVLKLENRTSSSIINDGYKFDRSILIDFDKDTSPVIFTRNKAFLIDEKNKELVELKEIEDKVRPFANVIYDETADCPEWKKFINFITGGDNEYAEYLQTLCGYALYPANPERKIFFLSGRGRNGKSTFLNVLNEIFAGYCNRINLNLLLSKTMENSVQYEMFNLKGKRLGYSEETKMLYNLREDVLKDLTGDNVITARPPFCKPISFEATFKLFIIGNDKPCLDGADTAIWDRFVILPFNNRVSDENLILDYSSKLLKESSGIFNWILEGLKRYLKNGLGFCEFTENNTTVYREEMDSIGAFLNDYLSRNKSSYYILGKVTNVESEINNWLEDNGFNRMPKQVINNQLNKKGYSKVIVSIYGKNEWCFVLVEMDNFLRKYMYNINSEDIDYDFLYNRYIKDYDNDLDFETFKKIVDNKKIEITNLKIFLNGLKFFDYEKGVLGKVSDVRKDYERWITNTKIEKLSVHRFNESMRGLGFRYKVVRYNEIIFKAWVLEKGVKNALK